MIKTWQERVDDGTPMEPFTGREKAMCAEIAELRARLNNLVEFIKNADVRSGVCCCGDDMDRHGNDHSPVDQWDHAVMHIVKEHGQ